jgi:hypothetical protein
VGAAGGGAATLFVRGSRAPRDCAPYGLPRFEKPHRRLDQPGPRLSGKPRPALGGPVALVFTSPTVPARAGLVSWTFGEASGTARELPRWPFVSGVCMEQESVARHTRGWISTSRFCWSSASASSTRSGSDSRISMAANAVLHHRQFTDSAPAQTREVSVAGLCNLPGLKEGRDRAARDGTSAARSPGAMPGLGLDLVSRRGLLDLEGGMPQRRRRARAPGVPGRLGHGANPRSDEATGW